MRVFPDGRFVCCEAGSGAIVGKAASLVVLWDDYAIDTSWRDFTDAGMFANHEARHGHALYGAEVRDATLSFQLRRGFRVLAVISG